MLSYVSLPQVLSNFHLNTSKSLKVKYIFCFFVNENKKHLWILVWYLKVQFYSLQLNILFLIRFWHKILWSESIFRHRKATEWNPDETFSSSLIWDLGLFCLWYIKNGFSWSPCQCHLKHVVGAKAVLDCRLLGQFASIYPPTCALPLLYPPTLALPVSFCTNLCLCTARKLHAACGSTAFDWLHTAQDSLHSAQCIQHTTHHS